GLMLGDAEEEQDCFSDNTHNSHYFDAVGIANVWRGTYRRVDGSIVSGPALSHQLTSIDPDLAGEVEARIEAGLAALEALRQRAEAGEAYDQMIAPGNVEGNALVQAAIDALVAEAEIFRRAGQILGLEGIIFEGSESLDDPGAIFR